MSAVIPDATVSVPEYPCILRTDLREVRKANTPARINITSIEKTFFQENKLRTEKRSLCKKLIRHVNQLISQKNSPRIKTGGTKVVCAIYLLSCSGFGASGFGESTLRFLFSSRCFLNVSILSTLLTNFQRSTSCSSFMILS